MPEVVEVCLTALWLNDKLHNKIITNMNILSGRYTRHPLHGSDLFKKNKPFRVIKVDSKGKFLWFVLEDKKKNNYFILNHFGLEGEWGFTKYKHSHVLFQIKDNIDLYFTDSRNFGTIEITNDVHKLNKILDTLGPDFLKEKFTNQDFYNRIVDFMTTDNHKIITPKANKKIITVLMDQKINTGLGSGLGNYLAPESLYRAGISPHTKIKELYDNQALSNNLAKAIKYTVKLAFMTADIGYLSDLDDEMSSFVTKLRKNKKTNSTYHPDTKIKSKDVFTFNVYRQKKDPLGNTVKADKIIPGRTTYWVPNIQN